ncbi:hypothetical protein CCACVL1_07768 [Corchorus capsularis]|uniref:Uncharacterized protein n=1 Tax=Corchorus capsularis TaxID=210143 RepID=A0A1R3J414_COCAP|nr:hypothetical protein CCACVL1_07768 [Corchorus capsularis]
MAPRPSTSLVAITSPTKATF